MMVFIREAFLCTTPGRVGNSASCTPRDVVPSTSAVAIPTTRQVPYEPGRPTRISRSTPGPDLQGDRTSRRSSRSCSLFAARIVQPVDRHLLVNYRDPISEAVPVRSAPHLLGRKTAAFGKSFQRLIVIDVCLRAERLSELPRHRLRHLLSRLGPTVLLVEYGESPTHRSCLRRKCDLLAYARPRR